MDTAKLTWPVAAFGVVACICGTFLIATGKVPANALAGLLPIAYLARSPLQGVQAPQPKIPGGQP